MSITTNSSFFRQEEEHEHAADLDLDRANGFTVECVCPKCGTEHRMKLLWSGRGKPKKYCPPCKSFVSTIESMDFAGIPTDIHKGIEKAV
jgi:hypothetical protein